MSAKTKAITIKKKVSKKPAVKPKGIGKTYDDLLKTKAVKIDFCGVKLTGNRYAFLVYYLTPGQNGFHNAYQAAIKAGYTESTANVIPYQILQEPDIQKIIKTNESLVYLSLHEAAKKAIEIKKQRAFYDPKDYFEKKTKKIRTKKGEIDIEVIELKNFEDMTVQQRMCIDGMEIKGQTSVPVYIMPDRAKELNDIIKIDTEVSKTVADTSEEETREIIIERIAVRETKRAQRPAELEYEIIDDEILTKDDEDDDV